MTDHAAVLLLRMTRLEFESATSGTTFEGMYRIPDPAPVGDPVPERAREAYDSLLPPGLGACDKIMSVAMLISLAGQPDLRKFLDLLDDRYTSLDDGSSKTMRDLFGNKGFAPSPVCRVLAFMGSGTSDVEKLFSGISGWKACELDKIREVFHNSTEAGIRAGCVVLALVYQLDSAI